MHHQKRRNPIWNDESVAQQVEHNTFNVGVPGSSPGGFTTLKESNNRLLFLYQIVSLCRFKGENPAKFCGLHTLQSDKIG